MQYGIIRTVAPTVEPITRGEVRNFARIDGDYLDSVIDAEIAAARDRCERVADLVLLEQTFALKLDCWPDDGVIRPPRLPLRSVTSITYVDPDGDTQTIDAADYRVDTSRRPGRIEPAYGLTWPAHQYVAAAITVTFKAGYGTAATDVPPDIKTRLMQCVAYRIDRPEDADDAFLDRLFQSFCSGHY